MKNLLFPLLGLIMMFVACKKEASNKLQNEKQPTSTKLLLSVEGSNKENLNVVGGDGLKSSALVYTSVVNNGDTIFWELAENSNISCIQEIIIIESESEMLFENGIVFNEDSTQCFGVIASEAEGVAKYDIKYKYVDGTSVQVDPEVVIRPPKK